MSDSQPSAHAQAQHFGPRRQLLVMVVVSLAFVMNLLDVTILHVAIPSIQRGLQASVAAVQWCVAGYTLVFATLLIPGNRLGDALGYRRHNVTARAPRAANGQKRPPADLPLPSLTTRA